MFAFYPALNNPEKWPKAMWEWMESLAPVGSIRDIEVSRDTFGYESDGGYKSYIPTNYLKLKVIIPPLEHCCRFVQYEGQWMKADENTDIAYTSKHETVAGKEIGYGVYDIDIDSIKESSELGDNDAFDLMDSIREELWK